MQIIIYSIPTCPWCKTVKDWLKKRKLSFEDRDIAESQNKTFRDELIEKSGQISVPVIDINGQIIVGFEEEQLKQAIEKAKTKK
ncbi:MAG: glutaredoxin family protein [Nanoarchaeota archaeon]